MNFSQFLNENIKNYIDSLHDEYKLIELIKNNCKNYDFNQPIWRGMKDVGRYAIIEGQKGGRVSVNTNNYYTKIIDYNLKKQSGSYPLRSKSIICSTDYSTALGFGDTVYLIIPFDNVIIGQCEFDDLWHSEITINGHKMKVHKWNQFWDKHNLSDKINSSDDLADQIIDIINKPNKDEDETDLADIFDNKPGIVKDSLRLAYSLKSFNFTFGSTKTLNMGKDNELWIGGKCIAVKYTYLDSIKKALKDGINVTDLYKTDDIESNNLDAYYNILDEYDIKDPTIIDTTKLNIPKIKYYATEDIKLDKLIDNLSEYSHNKTQFMADVAEIEFTSTKGELYELITSNENFYKLIDLLKADGVKFNIDDHLNQGIIFMLKKGTK